MSTRGKAIRGAGGLLKRNTDLGVSIGPPHGGNEGDIRVNMVNQQPRLYAKAGNVWYTTPLFETAGTAISEDTVTGENFLKVIGWGGMIDFSAGGRNIIIGSKETRPLKSLPAGGGWVRNIAIGSNTMSTITSARDTIAIGTDTLSTGALSAHYTVAIGVECMQESTGGSYNVAIGYQCLKTITGSSNIGIGFFAGKGASSTNHSVALGRDTQVATDSVSVGSDARSGTTAVGIGKSAAANATNSVCIGYRATGAIAIGADSSASTDCIAIGPGVIAGSGGAQFAVGTSNSDKITAFFHNDVAYFGTSDGTVGGTGSAGSGNEYVELKIGANTYKVLHDGTVAP